MSDHDRSNDWDEAVGGDESVLTAIAPSRRRVLGTAGAILGAGAAAGAGGVVMSEPAIQVSSAETTTQGTDENDDGFTANNVEILSNAGEVEDITVRPNLDIAWDGLNSEPEEVAFTVDVNGSSGGTDYTQIDSETFTIGTGALDGSQKNNQFDGATSIFAAGWSQSDFEDDGQAAGPGGAFTVEGISIRIEAELRTENENTFTDTVSDAFSVTVEDQDVEFGDVNGGDTDGDGDAGGVSGEAGTGGSADDDEEDDEDDDGEDS